MEAEGSRFEDLPAPGAPGTPGAPQPARPRAFFIHAEVVALQKRLLSGSAEDTED